MQSTVILRKIASSDRPQMIKRMILVPSFELCIVLPHIRVLNSEVDTECVDKNQVVLIEHLHIMHFEVRSFSILVG